MTRLTEAWKIEMRSLETVSNGTSPSCTMNSAHFIYKEQEDDSDLRSLHVINLPKSACNNLFFVEILAGT